MAKLTTDEIIEALKEMTLLEASELVKAIEDTFGVSAAAPAAVVAAPAAGAGAEEEEKTEFDVVLEGFGDNKIQVIKVVRELTSLGLKEAKEVVDADEVFTSWGVETARKFSKADIEAALTELDSGKYGMILRSKGIVDGGAEGWLEFDYVPGEWEVRSRGADVGGKLVVIGSKMDEKAIAALFGC